MDPADKGATPSLVLGTAGHIDHGKTSLVRALTGVDTDRLPEEKARGITIDLGFAPLELEDGLRLSIVDVPGHEKLVRTMVAGASGIDLVLLVVAADEGVMPQTREHLAICELLGLTRGVVALTKTDLAPDDLAELAEAEVAELLETTPLAGAPIVGVSSTSGDGIAALRDTLTKLARETAPRTDRSGPSRLAVDRTFEMRGFGSVVTGTLVGAPLSVGEAVEIQPEGLASRVRGIQHHGEAVEQARSGNRCALNLHGLGLDVLSRGQVVTRPGALGPTHTLDVQLQWLGAPVKSDGPVAVEFLAGTAERRARIAPIGTDALAPGGGYARVHIDGDAVALLPGDRFVVRGFARGELGATLGGGRVLDVAPPRRRRSDPQLRADLERLSEADPATGLEVRVARQGLAGAEVQALARETGLDAKRVRELVAEAEGLFLTGAGRVVADRAIGSLGGRLCEALDDHHAREPLAPGMPVATLRRVDRRSGARARDCARSARGRIAAHRRAARTAVEGALRGDPGAPAERPRDDAPARQPERERAGRRRRPALAGAAGSRDLDGLGLQLCEARAEPRAARARPRRRARARIAALRDRPDDDGGRDRPRRIARGRGDPRSAGAGALNRRGGARAPSHARGAWAKLRASQRETHP